MIPTLINMVAAFTSVGVVSLQGGQGTDDQIILRM